MIICVPSYRAPKNDLYENIAKYSSCHDFVFFVRQEEISEYRKYNTGSNIFIIPIPSWCINVGTTRRFIDEYMRDKTDIYLTMEDSVSYIGFTKPKASSREYMKNNVDKIISYAEDTVRKLSVHSSWSHIGFRKRLFCNTVKDEIITLNQGGYPAQVFFVNTAHGIHNTEGTDRISEDLEYALYSIFNGLSIGFIQTVCYETSPHCSRCSPYGKSRVELGLKAAEYLKMKYPENCTSFRVKSCPLGEYVGPRILWKNTPAKKKTYKEEDLNEHCN